MNPIWQTWYFFWLHFCDLFSESSIIFVLFAAKCVYDNSITHSHIHRNGQAHPENQILNDMGTEEKLRFNIDFSHPFLLFHARPFLVYEALCQPFDIGYFSFLFTFLQFFEFLLSTHNFIQYFLITEWHSCAYNQFIQFISYYHPYLCFAIFPFYFSSISSTTLILYHFIISILFSRIHSHLYMCLHWYINLCQLFHYHIFSHEYATSINLKTLLKFFFIYKHSAVKLILFLLLEYSIFNNTLEFKNRKKNLFDMMLN